MFRYASSYFQIVIEAASLPLSIIIVGIGDGNFDHMKLLDAVGETRGANGMKAKRDIVQFVPISTPLFVPRPDDPFARERLSRKVFVELLVSYMESRNFKPNFPHGLHSPLSCLK